MKRRLFGIAAAVSLLLSVTAAAAWVMSYGQSLDWHLLGMAHSGDLSRLNHDRRPVVLMRPVNLSNGGRHGFWDGLWALSHSGSLTLVAQTADCEGNVRGLYASPPSLIVDLSGSTKVRAVAFGGMGDSPPSADRLGFAWDIDAQEAGGDRRRGSGPVSVRVRMIKLPYWSIVVLGLTLPVLWLQGNRRSRCSTVRGS